MTALIVIIITVSFMGSALWIMPSRKERHKMSLRMHARKCQLAVQLTSIELPDKWDKVTNSQKTCAYRHVRPKKLKEFGKDIMIMPYEVWKYSEVVEGWWASRELPNDEILIKGLNDLKGLAAAVEVTESTVSVYWNENGDERIVDSISELILALSTVR